MQHRNGKPVARRSDLALALIFFGRLSLVLGAIIGLWLLVAAAEGL